VATTLLLLALAMEVAAVALYVANTAKAELQPLGFNGVGSLIIVVTFASIGWLIASRRRENRVGWILLVGSWLLRLPCCDHGSFRSGCAGSDWPLGPSPPCMA